jgi:hypothetical protein
MVSFGIDISHHQDAALDLAQCRREGIEFVFIKSSEGGDYVDPEFAANLAEARRAGMLVGAYHYVRSNATAAAQVANVRRAVPLDVAVIPDVEANSGGVVLVREFVDRLRAAGYRVPLLYLPSATSATSGRGCPRRTGPATAAWTSPSSSSPARSASRATARSTPTPTEAAATS